MNREENGFRYMRCMEEIKQRVGYIDKNIYRQNGILIHSQWGVETSALQLRMIYELIAFASLSANREAFELIHKSFRKENDFSHITKKLELINPRFIPMSLKRIAPGQPIVFEKEHHPIISRKDLVFRHGKLGNLLHARNPYKEHLDYADWAEEILHWTDEVTQLLNPHAAFLSDDSFLYVSMATVPDGRIQISLQQLVSGMNPQG